MMIRLKALLIELVRDVEGKQLWEVGPADFARLAKCQVTGRHECSNCEYQSMTRVMGLADIALEGCH